MSDQLRIIVLGYVIRGPLGGMVWSNLQYLLGLTRLGHEVYFFEDSDDYPSCYDPLRNVVDTDPAYGLAFAAGAFGRIGLGDRWAYHDAHTKNWLGPCAASAPEICSGADLLLDLCGVNPLRPWFMGIPCRVLVDEDPAFTQILHLTDPRARSRAQSHTAFFTFAHNFGTSRCAVPDDGVPWQVTRQPVVMSRDATPGRACGKFTTVMLWDSYKSREHGGVHYGMKSESFAPFLDLPAQVDADLELAVGSDSAPRDLLQSSGWSVRDPREPTRDPVSYQAYIDESKAEFSVAKHGYVVSHSGWFSERSVAYLAAGRPVVVQDTGFSDWLKTGAGVLPFRDLREAVEAIRDVNGRYEAHCRAARSIAEEYFESGSVLRSLLDRALSSRDSKTQ